MPQLLSDKIKEFMDWLEINTDFGDWDYQIKVEVEKKLIEIMISEPTTWLCQLGAGYCTHPQCKP